MNWDSPGCVEYWTWRKVFRLWRVEVFNRFGFGGANRIKLDYWLLCWHLSEKGKRPVTKTRIKAVRLTGMLGYKATKHELNFAVERGFLRVVVSGRQHRYYITVEGIQLMEDLERWYLDCLADLRAKIED